MFVNVRNGEYTKGHNCSFRHTMLAWHLAKISHCSSFLDTFGAFSENCTLHSKPCQTCLGQGDRQGAEGDAAAAAQRPPGGVQAVHGPAAAAQQRGQDEEEIR